MSRAKLHALLQNVAYCHRPALATTYVSRQVKTYSKRNVQPTLGTLKGTKLGSM